MKVGEFFVDLGIKTPGAVTLKDFIGKMGDLRLSTVGAIGALGTIGTVFAKMVSESASAAVSFQLFTAITGKSAQELQKWQNAGELVNVSTETVAGSFIALSNALAELQRTGARNAQFAMLGVYPGQAYDIFDVMGRLMDKSKKMTAMQYSNLVSGVGVPAGMMPLMQAGRANLKAGFNLPIMSKAEEDRALGFIKDYKAEWIKLRGISRMVATDFMEFAAKGIPVLSDMIMELRGTYTGKISPLRSRLNPLHPLFSVNSVIKAIAADWGKWGVTPISGGARPSRVEINVNLNGEGGMPSPQKIAKEIGLVVEKIFGNAGTNIPVAEK